MRNTLLTIAIATVLALAIGNAAAGLQKPSPHPALAKAQAIRFRKPDSAMYYFEKSIAHYQAQKDTANLIDGLVKRSHLYSHSLNYGAAYDGYWRGLLLAEKSKDTLSIGAIHQALGWLYGFYQRDSLAMAHLAKALRINQRLHWHEGDNLGRVHSDYYALTNFHRVNGRYDLAQAYLDSCYHPPYQVQPNNSAYLDSERAFLLATNQRYGEALALLGSVQRFAESQNPNYLIVVHNLLAQVYGMQKNDAQSERHYHASLRLGRQWHGHANYKVINHEALAKLYHRLGRYEEAYHHISQAKKRSKQIFGNGSQNSKYLFEIKDQYRMQKARQAALAKEQRLAQLEQGRQISRLKQLLMAVTLASLLLFGGLAWHSQLRKHRREKAAMAEKRAMEIKKSNDILDVKNKEMLKYALQLVEKEEFIEQLKTKLKKHGAKEMLKAIEGHVSNNWKAFEARFVATNEEFYAKLKARYPDLSPTDLKVCALVKLNFSSKDMASLLGMSVESVHTSRHRLRKKLNLNRGDNLGSFIGGL